jgi:hypothetical protein
VPSYLVIELQTLDLIGISNKKYICREGCYLFKILVKFIYSKKIFSNFAT